MTERKLVMPDIKTETFWDYSFFREYLLAVARDERFILPFDQFPDRITLSKDWHEVFNPIRKKTYRDKKERYGVIVSEGLGIRISSDPVLGLKEGVDDSRIESEVLKAEKNFPRQILIGDFHTHPYYRNGHAEFTVGARPFESGLPSVEDMQQLLAQEKPVARFFMAVLDQWNSFVFRTKDSKNHPSSASDNEATFNFMKYWFEKYGYSVAGDSVLNYAARQEPGAKWEWEVYKGLCDEYKIVLYKGAPNGDLFRIYPPIKSIS